MPNWHSNFKVFGQYWAMAIKKASRDKIVAASKSGGFFVYHGIKIAKPEGKRSKTGEIIRKELLKRSESRGERKSA
jgi:hypothetical protein